jgi:PIN domain nuclease of toxin-antitoxin system
VRVLLDTNSWIWLLNEPDRLAPPIRALLADEKTTALVSLASVWEVSIKVSIQKLDLTEPVMRFVERSQEESGLQLLPISLSHVLRVATLPLLHKDPFDRLLIAQGLLAQLPIVTADRRFAPYGVEVLRASAESGA